MAGENRVLIPPIISKTVWLKNQDDEAFIRAEDSELWQRTYAHSTSIIFPNRYYFIEIESLAFLQKRDI